MTLSAETIQTLQQLYKIQDAYQPNAAIKQQISSKNIVALVGATCMGKNTVMETALQLGDQHIARMGRVTSRPPRADDDPQAYSYIPDTDTGLAQAFAEIEQGQWVNYAVNPHANLLYGSKPGGYPGNWNIGDVFATAVTSMRQLGFARTLAVSVVCEPTVWVARVNQRFPAGHPQRQARIAEAMESLEWSLSQTSDHYWVSNTGDPQQGGQQLLVIIHTAPQGQNNAQARSLAEACLEAAQNLAR